MQASKLRACLHTGNKTTSLPPKRRNTKLQACRPTGVIQTTSLPPYRRNTKQQALIVQPQRQQNFFFSFFFFSFPTPHRRSIKLLACRPTGVKQSNRLTATQATKLQACGQAGEIQKRQVYCNTGKTSYRLANSQACYATNRMKKTACLLPHRRKR